MANLRMAGFCLKLVGFVIILFAGGFTAFLFFTLAIVYAGLETIMILLALSIFSYFLMKTAGGVYEADLDYKELGVFMGLICLMAYPSAYYFDFGIGSNIFGWATAFLGGISLICQYRGKSEYKSNESKVD